LLNVLEDGQILQISENLNIPANFLLKIGIREREECTWIKINEYKMAKTILKIYRLLKPIYI